MMLKNITKVFLSLSLLIAGIAGAASPEEYLAHAREFLDKGEVKSALIELKNALRADPALVEARVMLGNLYLRLGDGPGAEKEFTRVAKLHASKQRWIAELGEAFLLQRKYQELLEDITLDPELSGEQRASVLTLRGKALLGLGKVAQAQEAFDDALALDPGLEPARIGQIQLALASGEREQASQLVDALLTASPDNASGLLIRAELDRQKGDNEKAVATYTHLIKLNAQNQRARIGRAAALIALGKTDRAVQDLDAIANGQRIPMVQYLRAVIAFRNKDMQLAAQHLERVFQVAPNHVQSMLLYSVANYSLGRLETADQYISRVIKVLPDNPQALKLYAAVKMKLKQPEQAIAALEPRAVGSDDAQLLALLGSAYIMKGDNSKGSELLAQAVAIAPNMASLRAQLALGLLAEGETDQAISELKSAVDLGQDLLQADILLVLAQVREQRYAEALEASSTLERRRPDSALPYNLTGLVLLAKKDYQGAAAKFRKALEINPDFTVARLNLARVALAQGDSQAAEHHYREVLARKDNHLGAQMGLAALAQQRGDRAAMQEWLEKAYTSHPKALQPGLWLAELHRQVGEPLKALRLANELSSRFPGNPKVLLVLGRAQLATRAFDNAAHTFQVLVERQGPTVPLLTLLARARAASGDFADARKSYRQALELAPDDRDLLLSLGSLELRTGQFDRALEIAQQLQKQAPKLAAAYHLEGSAQLGKKQAKAALTSFEKAYSLQPSARRAEILSGIYRQQGDLEQASNVLQDWVGRHPEDSRLGTALAMGLQQRGLEREAILAYQQALKADPNNMVAVNNLAWLYFQIEDPRALDTARKAYDLAPERPEVVDTYGWIMLKHGDPQRALVVLQQALVSAPDNPEISYHVAVALDRVGRGAEAKKLLQRLLKNNPSFDGAEQAKGLLQRLGG